MKSFELDKGYEEIEIADTTYKIDLSDQKRKEYQRKGLELKEAADRFSSVSDEMSEEETQKTLNDLRETTGEIMDLILGDGAFDEIYRKANRSVFPVVDVLLQVVTYLNEVQEENYQEKRKKYINRK